MCSDEGDERSQFISKLYHYKRPFIPKTDLVEYKDYLAIHLSRNVENTDVPRPQYNLPGILESNNSIVQYVKFMHYSLLYVFVV